MTITRLSAMIHSRLQLAKLAGAALWLAWLVSLGIGGGRLDAFGKPIGVDHLAPYSAARLLVEGQGERAYDYRFAAEHQSTLIGTDRETFVAYRIPPFFTLLYLPTCQLPYAASFLVWTVVSFAALWFGVSCLKPSHPAEVVLWALTFYPVFATISFGQNSLLAFALICLVYRLLDGGHPLAAGLAAGLLLFKPQLLLGLGLWWLLDVRRHAWCWVGLALTATALGAMSWLGLPRETTEYLRRLPEIAAFDDYGFWNKHTPRAFWSLLLGNPTAGHVLGALSSLAAVAGFIWFWWRQHDNRVLMFAAAVFLTLVASPHAMVYEWTLALVPAVLLWEHVPGQRPLWLVLFAAGWLVLFVSSPLAKLQLEVLPFAVQLSVPMLAGCGVVAAVVLRRQEKSERHGVSPPV